MKIVTTEYTYGQEIKEALGLVWGNSTRARFFGRKIFAFFKNFTGGKFRNKQIYYPVPGKMH